MSRDGVQNNGGTRAEARVAVNFPENSGNSAKSVISESTSEAIGGLQFGGVLQDGGECSAPVGTHVGYTETDPTVIDMSKTDFSDVLAEFEAQVTDEWLKSKLEGDLNLDIMHDDPGVDDTQGLMISALNLMSTASYDNPRSAYIDPSTWLNFDDSKEGKSPCDVPTNTSSGKILNAIAFGVGSSEKCNSLMSAQELENMTETGLEFDTSIGPAGGGSLAQIARVVERNNLKYVELINVPFVLPPTSSLSDGSETMQLVLKGLDGTEQMYEVSAQQLRMASTSMQPLSLELAKTPAKITPVPLKYKGTVPPKGLTQAAKSTPGTEADPGIIKVTYTPPPDTEKVVLNPPAGKSPPKVDDKIFPCDFPDCDKKFSKKSRLKLHQMKHKGERPYKCHVEGCDWAFTTAHRQRRHMDSHMKLREFKCEFEGCTRMFSTIYNLNAHRKLHGRLDDKSCPAEGCGQRFPTQRALDYHMAKHPDVEKKYKCPREGCDRRFRSANSVGSHMRTHNESRNLTCKYCGKTYDKLCRLNQHVRSHTGERPYPCNFPDCNSAFSTASKLTRHQLKHSQIRRFVCTFPECNKMFLRSEHLKGHMVVHTKDRPFICTFEDCNAKFTAKHSLSLHLKKHRDNKVPPLCFYCPIEGCSSSYPSKASLRNHLMKHYKSQKCPDSIIVDQMVPIDAIVHTAADGSTHIIEGLNVIPSTESRTLNVSAQEFGASSDAVNYPTDVIIERIGNNVVTQLIATDITQAFPDIPSVTTQGSVSHSQDQDLATIAINTDETDSNRVFVQDKRSGSARTDYYSNQLWSDRAKKRQQLLREKANAAAGIEDMQEYTSRPRGVSSTGGPTLSPHELLTSRAITFRDPETGTTYVQTQLLQDDPPNPEFFGNQQDTTSLPSDLLRSAGDNSLGQNTTEFTGTTINMQDLE